MSVIFQVLPHTRNEGSSSVVTVENIDTGAHTSYLLFAFQILTASERASKRSSYVLEGGYNYEST